jgi:hypothetical protein
VDIATSALNLIHSNQFFAGGVGVALIGWALMQIKAVPTLLWGLAKLQLTTETSIYSEDAAFRTIGLWLAGHPAGQKARRLHVMSWWDHERDHEQFELTPGTGYHLLREEKDWFLVHREVEKEKADGFSGHRRETITITTFGRSQRAIRRLIDKARKANDDNDTVPVFIWESGEYVLVTRRMQRPLDSVFLPTAIKDEITADLGVFLNSRDHYTARGLPYRRGYMFKGPPGNGKTTLIFALAGLFGKPVYIIQPSTIANDNALQKALNSAGSGFVVIEDIDAVKAAEARAEKDLKARRKTAKGEERASGFTLSGLLNAIDGLASQDGRVLFITTNHAENLDPALLRPGRVDRQVEFEQIKLSEARAMYEKFYPEGDVEAFAEMIPARLPMSAAEMQNLLLTNGPDFK